MTLPLFNTLNVPIVPIVPHLTQQATALLNTADAQDPAELQRLAKLKARQWALADVLRVQRRRFLLRCVLIDKAYQWGVLG